MSIVNVTNVVVLDNPTAFKNPLTFEVTFECLEALDADLEWKVIYVGSAEDTQYDQVLEEVDVGPIPIGVNKFVLTAESPDPATIPPTDLVGVTVTLITCCYKQREFIRVGYYVNNEHNDPAVNAEIQEGRIPPADTLDPAHITRNILADKPRVTRFPIDWNAAPGEAGAAAAAAAAAAAGADGAAADGAMDEDDEMGVDNGVDEGEGAAAVASAGGEGEGSESMGSDGDDDESVDSDGSGDAMADEADADADMDADSSGAEEMEDVAGDEARAGTAAMRGAAAAAAVATATPVAGGLSTRVLSAASDPNENIQPIVLPNSGSAPASATQVAAVAEQVSCGKADGIAAAPAATTA
ncbi:conserved unknown protein [Ectocarpus siliculosus]|uniref:Anti-silencing factor n=1 Tax=Ectocarpus siliculosus TaxID=2880 RepID=D8LS96_ECTSI|nr:conserved unknown protein [Ectocarpus siliculosus]|eukprot:CBN75153.1 conserved unknown protein [Ectocarpus siliculosus]